MWVFGAAATVACYLILSLTMTETAHGYKSNLERSGNTVSSQDFRHKVLLMGDDDDNDDGMENSNYAEEDDGGDNSEDDSALSEDELEPGDDGVIEEDGEPSKDYLKELHQDDMSKDRGLSNEPAQGYARKNKLIRHGSRVVIQQRSSSRYWIDCGSSKSRSCKLSTCAGLYYEREDYSRCYSLMFQILRHRGRGFMRNGDFVGLYNLKKKSWFGCATKNCNRFSCPGRPTYKYGFKNSEKWLRCWGEVFRIYARNKKMGELIHDHDQVGIYYLQEHKWVKMLNNNKITKSTCMGRSRPPGNSKFESCYRSTFEIHKV